VIPGFVTGLGIFARHEANGVAAPAIFGTITPDKVGRAVVGAIRRDVPEIIVTTRPIRPSWRSRPLRLGPPSDSPTGLASPPLLTKWQA
jgi:hypothetical protein